MRHLLIHAGLGFAMLISASGAASASTIFNFAAATDSEGNSYGNTLQLSSGGLTVTESAYYLSSGYTSSSKFGTAAVDDYNGTNLGLGVCSPNDPSCSNPYHQMDNYQGDEFIVFQFSQAVNLSSIQITNYAPIGSTSDVDLTYFTSSTNLTTNTTLGSLGSGTNVTQNCTGTACQGTPFVDSMSGSNVTYLIVAAEVNNSDGNTDAFKINDLSVNATPEPGTIGMMVLAISGLAMQAWRRRKHHSDHVD
jgi:hypothetical protein